MARNMPHQQESENCDIYGGPSDLDTRLFIPKQAVEYELRWIIHNQIRDKRNINTRFVIYNNSDRKGRKTLVLRVGFVTYVKYELGWMDLHLTAVKH
jgi:prephenate dehydratase